MQKIFCIPDTHFTNSSEEGGHDETAYRLILRSIDIVKPDVIIHIGDVGEWNSVSHWKWKRRKRPPLQYVLRELECEAAYIKEQFNRIPKAKKRILIEGNHDFWLRSLREELPQLGEEYTLSGLLGLRESGWELVPYGQYKKIGQLHFYHGGHYTSKHHANEHATRLGGNVLYGDRHDIQHATVSSLDGPHGAWSIGCCCKLEKSFLRGRQTNWQHAFAVVYVFLRGFQVAIHRIENGQVVVEGKLLTEK